MIDLKEYRRQWRQRNIDHVRFLQRAADARCREKRRLKNRLWYQKNKAKRKEYNRLYRLNHLDYMNKVYRQWTATHRDQINARQRAWTKRHPEWVKVHSFRRRTRGRLAPGKISQQDFLRIRSEQNNLCFYCQCTLTSDNTRYGATFDHMVPLTRNGTNWPSNLVVACRSCNSKKRMMTTEEYMHYICEKLVFSRCKSEKDANFLRRSGMI